MHRRAVFTRNYKEHLEEACKRKEPTAFQSKKKWSGAQRWLKKQGTLKVYIAPVDSPKSGPKIMYEGTVKEIALVESAPEATVKKLLAARGEETRKEELWKKTVYLLSDCCEIPATPLSALRKAKDGTNLSDDYNYSYSIILERGAPIVG